MPLVQLNPEIRPAFERLMRHAWDQNWDDTLARRIIRWRYYDRPKGDTWVVMDGDQCVGLLDSMQRPHLLDGERIMIRETADWFCLPENRTGVGVSLLRRVMDYNEPLLVIGGSQPTLELLPKFRFTSPPAARHYILPLTTRGFAANLIRQKWWRCENFAKIIPDISSYLSRHPRTPKGGDIRILGSDAVPLPSPQNGLSQVIEPWHWQWLLAMPRQLAVPVGLAFYIDDEMVGCSISQLEPSATGLDGRILHLQYPETSIGIWLTATTVRFLSDCGAGFIRCRVSTPEKFATVEAAGFFPSRYAPIHWYSRQVPCPGLVDAGYLRGDDAMPLQALRGRKLKGDS